MKFLLDENLSHRLVARIIDLFPDSRHVSTENLLQVPDREIWEFAKMHGFTILTADSDFYDLATALGFPPKVVWLKGCDYPNTEVERLLRTQVIRIIDFLADPERAVLILMKK